MASSSWAGALWSLTKSPSAGKKNKDAEKAPESFCRSGAYDMQQAEWMQGNGRNPSLTADDVQLGLAGLDEADALRKQHNYQASLRLYKMALELLLRVLRENNNVDACRAATHDSVQVRVQAALTHAEHVKAQLSRQGNSNHRPQQQATAQSTREQRQPERAGHELSRSLQSRLSGNRTAPAVSSTTTANKPVSSYQKSKEDMQNFVVDNLLVDRAKLQAVAWDDIAGLAEVKQALQEAAILPLVRPDLMVGLTRRVQNNVLLYGPPGSGKTILVKCVAQHANCHLISCSASQLTSKWMGEAEKLVQCVFEVARAVAPCLVFVDEVDALLSTRQSQNEHEASRRLKTEFMTQMDGLLPGSSSSSSATTTPTTTTPRHVLVLACTNCPWDLDPAVLRRFPRRVYVPLPDADARAALLRSLLRQAGRHSLTRCQIKDLVQSLQGYSGSDITALASEAAFGPLRSLSSSVHNGGSGGDITFMDAVRSVPSSDDLRPISYDDFQQALAHTTRSVPASMLDKYDEWR